MIPSLIEHQFPVSKVSKESYKERKAGASQTLTAFGKWWGRKPLILIRAALLASLIPATNNPERDLQIFLKILAMDNDGLLLRKNKNFTLSQLHEIIKAKFPEYTKYFVDGKLSRNAPRDKIESVAFSTLNYDEKLSMCLRPEQAPNLPEESWLEINSYLGTDAHSLNELIQQLSLKRFGHNCKVGDCFCGGGSVPFEAARIGCDVFASDLNPVSGLLTWASLNISGGSPESIAEIQNFMRKIYDELDSEITALGIEHNDKGDRAISYIYCVEAKCPDCGAKVPLAPSWIIGKGTKTIVKWKFNPDSNSFDEQVISGVSNDELKAAEIGTVTSRGMTCPHCGKTTPISVLRHDTQDSYGLRQWELHEFEPRPDDVFQERLYAIRYEHEYTDDKGKKRTERYYTAPTARDLDNEHKVRSIVAENISRWQEEGLIPSMAIELGIETERLIRERGWRYWHQLFNARQLYLLARLKEKITNADVTDKMKVAGLLGIHRCVNFNSKLSRFCSVPTIEKVIDTFNNQALNTLMNYGSQSLRSLTTTWFYDIINAPMNTSREVTLSDSHDVKTTCDVWITDPPYADAVNYHDLSEFFLAWDAELLTKIFPDWYVDSKRPLALRGGENFAANMVDIYGNLTRLMNDEGIQIVMFTHKDSGIWSELARIMRDAGLRVTAAWNIATETDASGLKDGDYVKGTVLMVLRKRMNALTGFLNEIMDDVRDEVGKQIESMQALDDNKEEPNFSDPDYVLAAYAASLKVLTEYKEIVSETREYTFQEIIEQAKKYAYDYMIPKGFNRILWREFSPAERFYIKGLEAEKHGNYKVSTYQEYSKGFGLGNYGALMASARANNARLKTASEFAMRSVKEISGFDESLLRILLAGLYISVKEDDVVKGFMYIKNNVKEYWQKREILMETLKFLEDAGNIDNMRENWREDSEMAQHIRIRIDNDHI